VIPLTSTAIKSTLQIQDSEDISMAFYEILDKVSQGAFWGMVVLNRKVLR
jgi:hypothetical protein